MPDDSPKSKLNPLDIQGTPKSPMLLALDGRERLRLLAIATRDIVFDLAVECDKLVLTLYEDGREQVFGLPWLDPRPTSAVSVCWQPNSDANGYTIEVPAVASVILPDWIRSGILYSATSQQNGPTTVFRPRRETPK